MTPRRPLALGAGLQQEHERVQAAHEEVLLCIRNEAACTSQLFKSEMTMLDAERDQVQQYFGEKMWTAQQGIEEVKANCKSKTEAAQKQLADAQQRLQEMQGTVEERGLELQQLKEQHAKLVQKAAEAAQQHEQHEKRLGEMEAQHQQQQGQLEAASHQNQTDQTRNTQIVLKLKNDLDAAVADKSKVETDHAELRRERDALARRVEELQAALGTARDAEQQAASEAAAKIEALQRDATTLQGREQEGRRRCETLEKELHDARRQADEAARGARTEADKCAALEKQQQAACLPSSSSYPCSKPAPAPPKHPSAPLCRSPSATGGRARAEPRQLRPARRAGPVA